MPRHFDVVVVGAGPAGSFAAFLLARAGFQVALLDRARFPRAKVCGDSVNPNVGPLFERHGLTEAFRALTHQEMNGFILQVEGKTVFQRTFTGTQLGPRAVSRTLLDDWLRKEAEQAGAQFFPETVVTGWQAPGTVQTGSGDFSGEVILAADGRNSLLARLGGLIPTAARCHRVAYQATLPLAQTPLSGSPVLLNLFPEGYYGLNRINEEEANLCLILDTRITHGLDDALRLTRRFLPALPDEVEWRTTSPITRSRSDLGKDRLWLLGDAARVVEPFTGEGIYLALATAELAAEQAGIFLKTGKPAALKNYQRAHARLYRSRIWVNSLTRWLLREPRRALALGSWLPRIPGVLRFLTDQVHAPK